MYLLAIVVSLIGVGLIDRRFRLALFADARATIVCVLVTAALLLAWDLIAIGQGIFLIGDSPALLGVELLPHLPPEELVFLVFLPYCALVAARGAARLPRRRQGSRS